MARGDINFRMGADASQAIAENGKYQRSQRGVQDEKRGSIRVSQSMANRIFRDVEPQQERFKRLRNEVFRAWQDGKLSADTYGCRVRQLESDYKSRRVPSRSFRAMRRAASMTWFNQPISSGEQLLGLVLRYWDYWPLLRSFASPSPT